ncbi:MAG: glycosyltransferase [Bacteroidales bacterium]|nr:glycosyltransferase [Candidatus Scybalocola fimicaballi]
MKISVVTVTFNSEKTIACTIESVLNQKYDDYEYIVVDGGSKDTTVDIIKEWEPKFNGKMRWISERDKGMYDGINKGIRMATGDVVGIINSDDFFHRNDIFEKINDAFVSNPDVEAIYGDVRFVNPDNLEKTVRYYSSKNWAPWRFRFGFMPAHPSFYTKRENFEKYGFYQYDYHIAADYELLIRHLYTNKVPSKYIPLDFMKMRTGGRSTDGIKANIRLNKEIVRACSENGIWTCLPLLFLKYFVKVFELVFTRENS